MRIAAVSGVARHTVPYVGIPAAGLALRVTGTGWSAAEQYRRTARA
jgi:hypothetical protein